MSKCITVLIALVALALPLAGEGQFANPSEQTNAKYRNNPCRDPWISYGYIVASGGTATAQGVGDHGECDPQLYLSGRWSSFNQLVDGIREVRNAFARHSIAFSVARESRGIRVKGFESGRPFLSRLIGLDGGGVIGNDGGSLVPAGNYSVQSGARQLIRVANNHNLVIVR